MYQSIKQLRNHFLGLLWRIQSLGQFSHPVPTESATFDEWQSKGVGGRILLSRPGLDETIPPLPWAGNWNDVQPALDSLPPHMRSQYLTEINRAWRLVSPTERVIEIANGRTLTHLGIVLTPDHVQLNDLSGASIYGLTNHKTNFYVRTLPPVRRLRGRVLLMASGLGQRNFYHWTAEMMPRIRLFREAAVEYDHVLIPKRHPYHRESMQWLGIPSSKIVSLGKYAHIQADFLIVTNKSRQEMSSVNAGFLFEAMASQAWSKLRDPNRLRIYIARRKNGWRSVVNEQELIAALQPLGFQSVFLEDMSLMQQIQLFQQSDFVVGPHGSGLVNLAYCNSGTRVVEIGTPVRPNVLFHIIAHHRKLRYKNFFGRAVGAQGDESHVHVDVSGLLEEITLP